MGRTQIPEYPGDRGADSEEGGILARLRKLESKFWGLEHKQPLFWKLRHFIWEGLFVLLGGAFRPGSPVAQTLWDEHKEKEREKQYERVLPRSSRR